VSGEGFSVMAELRNAQDKQLNSCSIELYNHDGIILDGPHSIPGKFHKVFIVPPNKANYFVNILCPGFKNYEIMTTYGEDVSHLKPLKLGIIKMELLQE
jgi:hypothetical protein